MVEQACKIVGQDSKLVDVALVEVPGIYPKGKLLPKRMAKLINPAAKALDAAMADIVAAGGHLYISDMFRSTEDQQRAYMDWKTGRKSAYSPPAGGSMHEAARAIDIDVSDTGIGLAKTKRILKAHGWIGIAATGSECWHHDWRGEDGQAAYKKGGYKAMARYCIAKIKNMDKKKTAISTDEEVFVTWIQNTLNKITRAGLVVDGDYGPKTRAAVVDFQVRTSLTPDGIVGPITKAKLEKVLKDIG